MTRKRIAFLIIAIVYIVFSLFSVTAFAEGETTYTVVFDSQGGSVVDDITAENNKVISRPEDPVFSDHTFLGWYTEQECINEWDFDNDVATDDITLYAKWAPEKYTVTEVVYTITAVPNNESFGTVSGGGSYSEGETVKLTAIPNQGYRFMRWIENGDENAELTFTATTDITLTAEFLLIDTPLLTAVSSEYNSIALKWTSVAGADGYEIYRATQRYGTYFKIASVGADSTSYNNTALRDNKTYYYKVRAYLTSGSSKLYSNFSSHASSKAVPVLSSPSIFAQAYGYCSIRISWDAVPGAGGYEIYRATQRYGTYFKIASVGADSTSYNNTALRDNKTYYYKVRAYRPSGSSKLYSNFRHTHRRKAVPVLSTPSIFAQAYGYCSIRISWDAFPGAGGYEIYRATQRYGTYIKIASVGADSTSYNNTALRDNKTYYYKVRVYRPSGSSKLYSNFSSHASSRTCFTTTLLKVVSASSSSIRITWDPLTGVSGYELYRSTKKYGTYLKIYTATSAPTAIYTNSRLNTSRTYYYKIRAYKIIGSKKIYSPYSSIQSAITGNTFDDRSYTIYYQGDSKWKFSRSVRKSACLMTAYAITINNMGIPATPRTVYNSNCKTTRININNLAKNFGVKPVCALSSNSIYLKSFDGVNTFINNPSKNAEAAIKEALNLHPEGVILYFTKGSRSHSIAACKYDGDIIYFSDPGRKSNCLLTFNDTWVRYHHRMSYANLTEIIAMDEI